MLEEQQRCFGEVVFRRMFAAATTSGPRSNRRLLPKTAARHHPQASLPAKGHSTPNPPPPPHLLSSSSMLSRAARPALRAGAAQSMRYVELSRALRPAWTTTARTPHDRIDTPTNIAIVHADPPPPSLLPSRMPTSLPSVKSKAVSSRSRTSRRSPRR